MREWLAGSSGAISYGEKQHPSPFMAENCSSQFLTPVFAGERTSMAAGLLDSKLAKIRSFVADRVLQFRPFFQELEIAGERQRFFVATAQAASWYHPFSAKNRRELEWLIANLDLSGARIIDAGAFHGIYTMVLARAVGTDGVVVAVDPVASNCAVIEVNLAINGLPVRIENCAISNTDGEVAFSLDSCGHIIDRGGVKVVSKRLASVLPDATVLKIDIEGAEFSVIPEQIDEMTKARAWIVEIHPGMGGDPAVVTGAFKDRGYELWWAEPKNNTFQPYDGEPWAARTTLVARR